VSEGISTSSDGDKPQGDNDGDVLFEFFAEAVERLPWSNRGGDEAVAAGAGVCAPVPTIGADEKNNPDGAGNAVEQIEQCRELCGDGVLKSSGHDGGTEDHHCGVRDVIEECLAVRILAAGLALVRVEVVISFVGGHC